jgi:hypothetical protein
MRSLVSYRLDQVEVDIVTENDIRPFTLEQL